MEEETVTFFVLAVLAVPAFAGGNISYLQFDWLAGCYGCVPPVYSHAILCCLVLC